jgi:TolB protein
MHRVLVLFAALGAAATARAATAPSRPVLEISGASFQPTPLAVVPVKGAAPLSDALLRDLDLSGLFDLVDPTSFLAEPPTAGLDAKSIRFENWAAVGADHLVKGHAAGDDKSGWKLDLRLYQVATAKEVLKATYAVKTSELPSAAHEFADRVYRYFTNEEGIFRTRVAFVRKTPEGKAVWVSDLDGRNASAVAAGGGLNLLPAFAPEGRRLAFTSFRTGSPMCHLLDLEKKAVRPFPAKGEMQTGAAFSPDGKRIALTISVNGNSDIWVMNADGTGLKNLTDSRETESSPAWSPDGRRIAFVSTRSGEPQVHVMNADGTGVTRLTTQGRYNQTPDWSPRGDVVAFTGRDERNVFDLFTVNVETKQIKRLTQDEGHNEEPSFSPNGRHILFVSTRDGGRRQLWVMNADGTHPRPLGLADVTTPAWGPGAAK